MSEVLETTCILETDNWARKSSITTNYTGGVSGSLRLIDNDVTYANYVTCTGGTTYWIFDLLASRQINKFGIYFTPKTSVFSTVLNNFPAQVRISYSSDNISYTTVDAWADFNIWYGLEESVVYNPASPGIYTVSNYGILSVYDSAGISARYIKVEALSTPCYICEIEICKTVSLVCSTITTDASRELDGTLHPVRGTIMFKDLDRTYMPTNEIITKGDAVWLKIVYKNETTYMGGIHVLEFEEDSKGESATITFTDKIWEMADKNINLNTSAYVNTDMRKPVEDLLSAGGYHKDLFSVATLPTSTYIPKYDKIKTELDRLLTSLGDVRVISDVTGKLKVISYNDSYYNSASSGSGTAILSYVSPVPNYINFVFNDKFVPEPYMRFMNPNTTYTWTAGNPIRSNYYLNSATAERFRLFSCVETAGFTNWTHTFYVHTTSVVGNIKFSLYARANMGTAAEVLIGTYTVAAGAGLTTKTYQIDFTYTYPPGSYAATIKQIDNYGGGSTDWTQSISVSGTDPRDDIVYLQVEGIGAGNPSYELWSCQTTYYNIGTPNNKGYGDTDIVLATTDVTGYINAAVNAVKYGIYGSGYWVDSFTVLKIYAAEWDAVNSLVVGNWYDMATSGISSITPTGYNNVKIRIHYALTYAYITYPVVVNYVTSGNSSAPVSKSVTTLVHNLTYRSTNQYSGDSLFYNDNIIQVNSWLLPAAAEELFKVTGLTVDIGASYERDILFDDAVDIESLYVSFQIASGTIYSTTPGSDNQGWVTPAPSIYISVSRWALGARVSLKNTGTVTYSDITIWVYSKVYTDNIKTVEYQDGTSIEEYGKITKTEDNDLTSESTAPYVAARNAALSKTNILLPESTDIDFTPSLDFDTQLVISDEVNAIGSTSVLYAIRHAIDAMTLMHTTSVLARIFSWSDYTSANNLYNMKVPLWTGTIDEFQALSGEGEYARIEMTPAQGGGIGYYVKIDGVVRAITTDRIINGAYDSNAVFRPVIPTWAGTYNDLISIVEDGGMRTVIMPGGDGKNWICKIGGIIEIFA